MTDTSDLSRRFPTPHETAKAREAVSVLGRTTTKAGAVPISVKDDGKESTVELPPAVARMMLDLLAHIGRGEAVNLISSGSELTTQQAADILNVSRPFLVRLLDSGELPFHKVGTHRRMKASDVIEYRRRRAGKQKVALAELARLGQEIDAG
jgi:excisionase family DNA binding protein